MLPTMTVPYHTRRTNVKIDNVPQLLVLPKNSDINLIFTISRDGVRRTLYVLVQDNEFKAEQ